MPNISARLRSYQCGIYQGDYSRFQSDWIQVSFRRQSRCPLESVLT